ncbi:low molecular weight phosphatase family protein [Neomicrococcus aestuarii]|uniref:Phosphotyrosine protein phosphatase I domain-containing protein n=1 Tax=Neomicrococcus aestuarii TaxID=556325 RepID=A0A1L2ZN70_9MICC|nr:hypothetical protein [Neomicrococcus aestuarii]APF40481.1 hypothetical protein BHE16_04970 [Neomicrococcus aestuarii]
MSHSTRSQSAQVKLLTVCTGNICRSPYAERLLQAGMDELHPGLFSVTSAGTMAMTNQGMDQRSLERLEAAGGSGEGHVPRMLRNVMNMKYDLVFAMSEEHRVEIVKQSPRMLKRAYTIMMFADLYEQLVADPSSELVRGCDPESVLDRWAGLGVLAARARSSLAVQGFNDYDVPDPYRKDDDAYDQMEAALKPAIYRILAAEEQASARKF